jgi:hypothetical protein
MTNPSQNSKASSLAEEASALVRKFRRENTPEPEQRKQLDELQSKVIQHYEMTSGKTFQELASQSMSLEEQTRLGLNMDPTLVL